MNVQNFAVFLGILFLSAQGFATNNSFESSLEDAGRQYACPGEVVNYTCTVVDNAGTGSTFWRGTAFNCPPSNIISLSHQLFNIAGDSGTCNNGAITAESVGVVDNCYTSRLMVTVSSELNETTVECTLVVVGVGVGNRTLLVAAPPDAPQTRPVMFPTPREQFTITWTDPPLNMNETIDAYFVNISGPNDLCENASVTTLQMVTERSFTCFIQTPPQEGEVYTFTVRARTTICDGNLRGSESEPIRLQVPDAPIFNGFQSDCPGLSFVNINWQSPMSNNMLTAVVTDICVNYCIQDNCTDECRPVSGNNPFRINNIVNGTNYNISLSLRNDFGQSGQTTPELYENTDERCVTTPSPTPTPTPTPSTTSSPTPTQTPSQTPTQPPPQTTTPPTTGPPGVGGVAAGAIAGGVIGGLIGAAIVVLIVIIIAYLVWKWKDSPKSKDAAAVELQKSEEAPPPAETEQDPQPAEAGGEDTTYDTLAKPTEPPPAQEQEGVHYMQPEFSKPPDTTGGKAPDTSGKVPEPEAPVVYSVVQTDTKTD